MSMWGDYIKEHRDDGIIESENGFASYRFIPIDGKPSIYLVDIYVRPELRKSEIATDMANQVRDIGKEKGCVYLVGSVAPTAKKATESLRVLLAYGMRLHSASSELIIFVKEI